MVLVKTDRGQRVMRDRSVPLSPRQRAAFILFDGKRSAKEVLAATAPMGVTPADVDHLLALGLVKDVPIEGAGLRPVGSLAPAPAPPAPALPDASAGLPSGTGAFVRPSGGEGWGGRSPRERYLEAYPIATALTAGLGLRGFRLNLAVAAASSYEDLLRIAPRILEAVGPEKFAPLDEVLHA